MGAPKAHAPLRLVARAALARYGVDARAVAFVQKKTNAVFRVTDRAGDVYVLRVHPPEASVEALEDELRWLSALRRTSDLAVPEPLAARVPRIAVDGAPTAHPCVVLRWVPGRFHHAERASLARVRSAGAFVAKLHQQTAELRLSRPIRRPPWDEARLGANAALPRATWLSPRDRRALAESAARTRETLAAIGRGRGAWGLIHADLHDANMPWHQGRVGAIDFDDCGEGPFAFDLAVALYEWSGGGADLRRHDALLEGYALHRPPPPAAVLRVLMAARCARTIVRVARSAPASPPPERIRTLLAHVQRTFAPTRAGGSRDPR